MKQKPFELMRLYFGEKDECCGTCCNLREFRYNSKKVRKCIAYGGLHSQKADWAKRWPACGLYGNAVPQQMISDTAKQIFSRIGIRYDDWEFQVDGQISMEAMQDAQEPEI